MHILILLCALKLVLTNPINIERRETQQQLNIHYNPCSSSDYPSHSWPQAIVPYSLSATVPDFLRIAVQNALKIVENMSCVRFLPYTLQRDYVHIEYGYKCCSHTGKIGSGGQMLYVSEICISTNESLIEIFSKLVKHNHCEIATCGGSQVMIEGAAPGLIKSPIHETSTQYPPGANCLWKLWIPINKTAMLQFLKFNLEPHRDCLYDYLHIFEEDITGRVVNSTKLCGSLANYQINTTANASSVSVHFRSDEYQQYEGFEIQYSLTNDEVLCAVNNGGCSQKCLSNAQGVRTGCDCTEGYQLDSADQRSCIDIDECQVANTCNQHCTNTIGSYYCHCKKGYGLSSDMKTCESCGGNLDSSIGILTPPSNRSYQNCQWRISIWKGYYLNITVDNLVIPPSNGCLKNYLKPREGNFKSNKRRICGQYATIQYVLQYSGSQATFKYITGSLSLGKMSSFVLYYKQIKIDSLSSNELNSVNINGTTIQYRKKWI